MEKVLSRVLELDPEIVARKFAEYDQLAFDMGEVKRTMDQRLQ